MSFHFTVSVSIALKRGRLALLCKAKKITLELRQLPRVIKKDFTAWKVFVFGAFLVSIFRIRTEYWEIRSTEFRYKSQYSYFHLTIFPVNSHFPWVVISVSNKKASDVIVTFGKKMSNKHCPFHFEGVPWDYGVFLIKFGHIVDCYPELCCRWFFKEWVKIFCICVFCRSLRCWINFMT